MNTRISTILLAVAAEGLTAATFFLLLPYELLTDSIRWLDFAVITLIITLYTCHLAFPIIDMRDKSQRGVAGLGIKWWATLWYSILAILFMAGNIIYASLSYGDSCSFTFQAIVQGALLLFFLSGLVASHASMEKAAEVSDAESEARRGKAEVKASLTKLLNLTEWQRELTPELAGRVRRAVSEGRYLTPSVSAHAKVAERAIIDAAGSLCAVLDSVNPNQKIAEERLTRLEQAIAQRKRI